VPVVGSFWRYNWADLETGNGVYNWAQVDYDIGQWETQGKLAAIGFCIYNEYGGTGQDRGIQVPSWLWDIEPDVRWRNTRRNPEVWYVPNYWSTALKDYYKRFIEAFAQHLKDNPSIRERVAWVSMGVGMSGETQPSSRWGDEVEKPDWDYYCYDRGITQAQWVEYVNWCSYTYKQAFSSRGMSDLPIFVDIGPTYIGGWSEREEFSSYARSVGVGLRNNGLKMDRESAIYLQSRDPNYYNVVPMCWETYGTPGWLDSKAAVFWGFMCGLSKHPDNFTLDKTLWETEEYLPLLQFAARYCGVTTSSTPGAWVALRDTQHGSGETGNYELWLDQKDISGGQTKPEWNMGAKRRYVFDVPNGSHQVELHFAEVFYDGASGRIFDIEIEGQVVEDNFDIWVAAGGENRALLKTYATQVSDGRLDIRLVPDWGAGSADYPIVSGIKVTGPGGYEERINCGGARSYVDQALNTWVADREYESGSFGYIGGSTFPGSDPIQNTNDDELYQTVRVFSGGAPAVGRFARRTDQATGNTRMYFDIDNSYMYYGTFTQATITVTYYVTGTDRWQLKYDAITDSDRAAIPYGSSDPWVQKDNTGLWKQTVFYLDDARFANGQAGGTDFSIDCMGDGDEYISFVEVSKGGGSGPDTATLQGRVGLQRPGKPVPDPSWVVSLTVTFNGTPHPEMVLTDQEGRFTLEGLTPGTYVVGVKNFHALSKVRSNVQLTAGTNPEVYFDILLEGDADDNDVVNITDFSILKDGFNPVNDPRADFTQDGTVNISDFSLLKDNFGGTGDLLGVGSPLVRLAGRAGEAATPAGSAYVNVNPQCSSVAEGEIFAVEIQVVAGSQAVDGAEVHVDFDPLYLQVVDAGGNPASTIESSGILDLLFQNSVDSAAGGIDFAAGTFGAEPSDTFVLATVRFKALWGTGGVSTPLTFVRQLPRKTDATHGGSSVLAGATGGSVAIHLVPDYRICLPLMARQ